MGFSIFCDFDTCHKDITIDSLIGSPCIRRNTKVGFFEWEFAPHYVIFLEQKRTHVFVPKKETGNIDDDDDDTIGH